MCAFLKNCTFLWDFQLTVSSIFRVVLAVVTEVWGSILPHSMLWPEFILMDRDTCKFGSSSQNTVPYKYKKCTMKMLLVITLWGKQCCCFRPEKCHFFLKIFTHCAVRTSSNSVWKFGTVRIHIGMMTWMRIWGRRTPAASAAWSSCHWWGRFFSSDGETEKNRGSLGKKNNYFSLHWVLDEKSWVAVFFSWVKWV